MSDILTSLLGFKWRGISVPLTDLTLSLEQDHADHEFFNRDGADVEGTGRKALVISATIPFRNGVAPGLSEEFSVLYPDGWRAFFSAMADKSVGPLTHPELGDLQCKPKKFDTNWKAAGRDGVDATASWTETTEFDDSLLTALAFDSPIASAGLAAASLDGALGLAADQLPKTPEYKPDLADTLRGVAAIGDQLSLASGAVTGKLDQVMYRAGAIKQSFERQQDPRNFAALQAVSKLRDAVRSIAKALAVGPRAISLYRAPRDMTLVGLADLIPANLGDLMRLNPRLLGSPVVIANTVVQYVKL